MNHLRSWYLFRSLTALKSKCQGNPGVKVYVCLERWAQNAITLSQGNYVIPPLLTLIHAVFLESDNRSGIWVHLQVLKPFYISTLKAETLLSEGVPTEHTWCAQHTCFERYLWQGPRMQPWSDPLLILVPLGHPPTLKSAYKCFGLLTDLRLCTITCAHTGTSEIWGSMSQSMHSKDPASVQITYAVVTRHSENPPRGASRG